MFPSQNFKPRLQPGQAVLWLASILLVTAAPLSAQIQFAEELFPELSRLIAMAASDGTEPQLSALRVEEREGDLEVAVSQKRPQVRAFARIAGAYEMREDIDDRYRTNINANLMMTQPLYHWGSIDKQIGIANERVSLQGLESDRQGERHFMNIRRIYLQWLLLNERIKVLEQSVELSKSFVEARRQLVDLGQSSEQDVLEMEARLLENQESISWIENSISSLENQLSRLIGPGFSGMTLSGTSLAVIQPMSQDALDALARDVQDKLNGISSPEAERFSMLGDIESEYLDVLDKENHPKLDLVAGIFTDHLDNLYQSTIALRMQYFAGIQVNWSIFNGWQTDGRKRSTLARIRSYDLQEQAARDINRQNAESLLANLQLNLKQIEARGKRADILQRRQVLVKEQVERNLMPGSELVEVDIDYLQVQERLMEARINYLINLMELGVLVGQDPAITYYRTES